MGSSGHNYELHFFVITKWQSFEVIEKDDMKQGQGRGEVLADISVRQSETTCEFRCCVVNEKLLLK
jgi:hypothetical protein